MKATKGFMAISILSIVAIAINVFGLALGSSVFCSDEKFGCDMQLRRAEVLCSRGGVNPFRVWNREVVSDGFCPLTRPDFPDVEKRPGDLTVHSYPVWHTPIFWWYGLFPRTVCVAIMAFVFGVCALFVFGEISDLAKSGGYYTFPAMIFILAMIIEMWNGCFFLLNYGVPILAVVFLMIKALKNGADILAGFCWAFILIKPQVGLLFFWPLLFARKFKTIATAIFVCAGLTLLMSIYYHESPIDLVMQIPKIGVPYGASPVVEKILKPIVGPVAPWFWMVVWALLCGWLCYAVRNRASWIERFAPVALIFPVWAYSNGCDGVVSCLWFVFVAAFIFDGRMVGVMDLSYVFFLCFSRLFTYTWNSGCGLCLINPTGWGWVVCLIKMLELFFSLVVLYENIKDNDRR